MLTVKYMLLAGGIGMFLTAAAIATYDIYMSFRHRRAVLGGQTGLPEPEPVRWRTTVALVLMAWAPLLIALSIVVVPSGMDGVRVGQTAGTKPGTLYAGVHIVKPLVGRVDPFDTRDQLFTTGTTDDPLGQPPADPREHHGSQR